MLPIDEGREPVSELECMCILARLLMLPIDEGREPVRESTARSR
jgi:hypothetical protein